MKAGKLTFNIDLPYYGAFSVHFGGNDEAAIRNMCIKVKERINALTNKPIEEIPDNAILPTYEGYFYEFVNAMPLEFSGPKIKKCCNLIENKYVSNITKENVKKLMYPQFSGELGLTKADKSTKRGVNRREFYYLLIKLGASKTDFKRLMELYDELKLEEEKVDFNELKNIIEKNSLKSYVN